MKQNNEHSPSLTAADSKMFQRIFRDVDKFESDVDEDNNSDDDDAAPSEDNGQMPPSAGQMCLMCFRLFPYYKHPWSIIEKGEMNLFINTAWNPPPYQHIIEAILNQPSCFFIPVCQHCSCFIRKGLAVLEGQSLSTTLPENRPKHPVHLAVEFLLSGGCTPSPCHSVLNHLMESMAYDFPNNPLLQMNGLVLHDLVHSVLHHIETFQVEPHTYINFICLWKWLSTGSQRILSDHQLAKLMRKYLCDYPHHEEWWKQKLPKSACRFCYGAKISTVSPSFCSIIASPHSSFAMSDVLAILEKLEKNTQTVDHSTIFCCECCKFSVISYEYDCAFRSAMLLPTIGSADAYYTRMANLH